jgi:hypothetical protein
MKNRDSFVYQGMYSRQGEPLDHGSASPDKMG